jgi:hypothetical protein
MSARSRLEVVVGIAGLLVILVGAVLAFASKADADDVHRLQVDVAAEKEGGRWRDAALCGIARRLDVDVPPNPNCK